MVDRKKKAARPPSVKLIRSGTPSRSPSKKLLRVKNVTLKNRPPDLKPVEDRRTFHPLASYRPPKTIRGTPARIVAPKPSVTKKLPTQPTARKIKARPPEKRKATESLRTQVLSRRPRRRVTIPHQLQFADPRRVIMCVRRKVRKEVLHALGRTGRGSGGGRHRHGPFSGISCS